MNNKRTAFEDPKVEQVESRVKLDSAKSRYAKATSHRSADEFDEKVSEHQAHDQQLTKKILELSTRFSNFIKNRVLKQNKSPIDINLEDETVKELIQIALQLNNDETKPEGIGSVGVMTLLLRCMLAQRDIINNLEYEVVQLKKQVNASSNKQ